LFIFIDLCCVMAAVLLLLMVVGSASVLEVALELHLLGCMLGLTQWRQLVCNKCVRWSVMPAHAGVAPNARIAFYDSENITQ
jgi:hypothetical protein